MLGIGKLNKIGEGRRGILSCQTDAFVVVHVLEERDTEASVLGTHMNFSGKPSMSAVICWLQVEIRLSILMLECRCMFGSLGFGIRECWRLTLLLTSCHTGSEFASVAAINIFPCR